MIAFLWLWFTVELPDDLPAVESSVVVDAKGREIAVFQQHGLREPVELDQVSPVVIDALISAEDRSFFDHSGIDPSGIIRAMWHNVRGERLQGASTITQQLVKNSYLSSERSFSRKVKEAILAMKLEQTHDKRDILERYLNTVYLGRGTYGIQAAAKVYFNTTAAQLDTNQAAFLVGLLKSPETADPTTDPDAARSRRDAVLDAMVDNSKLDSNTAASTKQQPIEVPPPASDTQVTAGVAPWFVDLVRQEAIARFGESTVFGGGLKITTTLDLDDQTAAEEAIAQVLNEPDDPQAALVALDKSGAIRAYVGGRDYNALKVDLARGKQGGGTGRQAGSTFKPFVLAANAEQGATVTQVFPAPAHISLPVTGGGTFDVSNYGDEDFGAADLVDGTVNSINTVYAQLVLQVGPDKAVELARKAGIESELPVQPSVALGSGEVSPLELADAYLTFAREGERVEPFAIAQVQGPDGRTLYQAAPKTTAAMKADTAHLVDFVLEQVIERGTGRAAGLDRPAAGKTGTTENNVDAWFAGYTPNYAAVVWMGYPESNSRPMDSVHGTSVTGGTFPAQIWQKFMSVAVQDLPVEDFPPPPDALLAEPQLETTLSIDPSNGDPGVTINVKGAGFERCLAAWYVTAGSMQSTPQSGSTEDARSTTLAIPADATPGPLDVQAWCDSGTGPQPAARATFTVNGATTTTTTTQPQATTSTTTPKPTTTTTTTTTRPSTTTSTTSTTTSTTKP